MKIKQYLNNKLPSQISSFSAFMLMLYLSLFSAPSLAQNSSIQSLADVQVALLSKKNSAKQDAIEWLSQSSDVEVAKAVLTPWLEGNLYYLKSDDALFVITDLDEGQQAQKLISDDVITIENKRDFAKIRTNNSLRSIFATYWRVLIFRRAMRMYVCWQ